MDRGRESVRTGDRAAGCCTNLDSAAGEPGSGWGGDSRARTPAFKTWLLTCPWVWTSCLPSLFPVSSFIKRGCGEG